MPESPFDEEMPPDPDPDPKPPVTRAWQVDPIPMIPDAPDIDASVSRGREIFGEVEGPPPPEKLRYPEPSLEAARKDVNAAVFLAAWGEEVFLKSAYYRAWEAEWRHQCLSDAGLPDDAGLTKKPK